MKRFLEVTRSILWDFVFEVLYFIKTNIRYFGYALNVFVPYFMYYLGMWSFDSRGIYTIGGEAFIPIIVIIVSSYLRSFANKIGKGSSIPVPVKRFTECNEDSGEVTVNKDRLPEMLLYVADLEDWLSKKGFL